MSNTINKMQIDFRLLSLNIFFYFMVIRSYRLEGKVIMKRVDLIEGSNRDSHLPPFLLGKPVRFVSCLERSTIIVLRLWARNRCVDLEEFFPDLSRADN